MDEDDNRSVSFLHLLSVLKAAEEPPDFFFLENVRGFEGSHAHQRLLEVTTYSLHGMSRMHIATMSYTPWCRE